MADPTTLQYLKSIQETVTRIDDRMDDHGDRISSLEKKNERQAGMMIGGGAVVTVFAGVVTWLVDHFIRTP